MSECFQIFDRNHDKYKLFDGRTLTFMNVRESFCGSCTEILASIVYGLITVFAHVFTIRLKGRGGSVPTVSLNTP